MLTIAAGSGIASLAMNFWVPFLPLYMQHLGATSPANALSWVAIASTFQGFARLAAGPVWGILSDRYGRKMMFLRALYFASATTAIAALASEPWHIVVAFVMQGLFSGFTPAATALTSVSVPDARLNRSLGMVTGAQFIGNTLGPAIGGILAVVVGYRGAIVGAAAMPALAAVLATVTVPRDQVRRREVPPDVEAAIDGPASRGARALLTPQFLLVLAVFFSTISLSQVLRLATPIALERMTGAADVARAAGVAFTLAGLASVAGIVLAQRLVRPGRLQRTVVIACVVTGLAHLVLPLAGTVVAFIAAFALISMLQTAILPTTNTLIAANAPRDRRGTAFGLASGVQAVGFMVGPMAAAGFAAVSLDLAFFVLAALFVAIGAVVLVALREPALR